MSTAVMFIGLAVFLAHFLAHFLALQFRRTNIPDVLVLVLVGIVLGPLTGVVTPEEFGKIGPIIATIALVAIAMVALVFTTRPGLARQLYRGLHVSLRDAALTSMTAPKGLAAAVLAPPAAAVRHRRRRGHTRRQLHGGAGEHHADGAAGGGAALGAGDGAICSDAGQAGGRTRATRPKRR